MLFHLILLLSLLRISRSSIPLTLLDDTSIGRCLDGSVGGYYYDKYSDNSNSNKWVLYLEGGSSCDTQELCYSKVNSSLGSSNYFSNTSSPSNWYIGTTSCTNSPNICTWNHVDIPYCSQDLRSGQRTTPSEETWGLYFSGHLLFEDVLNDLDLKHNLNEATEIIIQGVSADGIGVSAGGIGSWMHADYLQERYPSAKVTLLSICGFYFYATFYEGANHTLATNMSDFRESGIENIYNLYNAFVDESCKDAYENAGQNPSACMLANNSYPYVSVDSYIVQSETDSVVLTGHDQLPKDYLNLQPEAQFMREWHENMTIALTPVVAAINKSGTFQVACWMHDTFSHVGPTINGLNFYNAFQNFYFDRYNNVTYNLMDDCGELCGTDCPN